MNLSGSATGTTVSDSNGNFSFGGLPLCGDYIVTPSKELYTFVTAEMVKAFITSDEYRHRFGQ